MSEAEAAHAPLPPWFEKLQDTVFLSALILAEMFVNGLMMTYGIVPNINDPRSWGIFGTVGVVVMFAAGMLMGGMSVRCSSAFFLAAKDHDWGFAAANLIGLFIFGMPEIWASLVERSTHLQVNAPDRLAMSVFGATNWAVTPTTVFISVALPFAAAYWGISSRKAPTKTIEEIEAERERKLAEQRARNDINALKMAGKRRAEEAYQHPEMVDASPVIEQANAMTGTPDSQPDTAPDTTPDMPPDGSDDPTGKRRLKAVAGSQWTRHELQEYAQRKYAQNISDEQAVAMVRMLGNGRRMGRAYVAHKKSVMAAIDRQYARATVEANAAG